MTTLPFHGKNCSTRVFLVGPLCFPCFLLNIAFIIQVQLATRQSTRWLVRPELYAVRARQPTGLRQLGSHGQLWMVIRRSFTLLYQVRGQPQSLLCPERVPWCWRIVNDTRSPLSYSFGVRLSRSRDRNGYWKLNFSLVWHKISLQLVPL